MTDEALELLSDRELLFKLLKRFGEFETQLEVIREGIAYNSARFDQLEAIVLDGKSIALQTRSQLTILTEEVRQMKRETLV